MKSFFPAAFFTGINYWESVSATQMWEHFSKEQIDADFAHLKHAGITHLRVFPLWHVFQPLTGLYSYHGVYEYSFGEASLPDTEAGQAGVSEEACTHFEILCALAEKHQLKLIVGLITGHMSFRMFLPPAFYGKDLLNDPTVYKWQLRFVRYFVKRFSKVSCIVGWDLGNEIGDLAHENPCHADVFYRFCAGIAATIRAVDPTRPIISGYPTEHIESGFPNLKDTGELCDMNTAHPYSIFNTPQKPLCSMVPVTDPAFFCNLSEGVSHIPTFLQEFGGIGYQNCSYASEARFYRGALLSALAHGCHGAMWWCAFDQGHLKFAPYNWNNIGSDYGFFDRNGNPKPVVTENLRFQELLSKLPDQNLPACQKDGVILIPREDGDADLSVLRATWLLGKQANLDLSFSYALDPIPEAPLYIFPSLRQSKSILHTRLEEVLERVKSGSILYLSLDTALFRRIPELTGVQFESRQCIGADLSLLYQSHSLPIHANTLYSIESCDAEILARDAAGTPWFFCHSYGKGKIFFLPLPLEWEAARRAEMFVTNDAPRYDLIYRTLADASHTVRYADTDSPYVRLTEHPLPNGKRYLFAIHYADRKTNCTVFLPQGGKITPIHGSFPDQNGLVHFEALDGAIWLWEP